MRAISKSLGLLIVFLSLASCQSPIPVSRPAVAVASPPTPEKKVVPDVFLDCDVFDHVGKPIATIRFEFADIDGFLEGRWQIKAPDATADSIFVTSTEELSGSYGFGTIELSRRLHIADAELNFSGVVNGNAVTGTWKHYTEAGLSATGTFSGHRVGGKDG
jgi:hypothetical protein